MLPRISLVTPCFNRKDFLEETIQSVLGQAYPNLEYIVIDGGSTDGSLDVLERYRRHFAHFVSEPDRGMYHALNKGFARSTGDVLCWLNSDDLLLPRALHVVADIFANHPSVDWLTSGFPSAVNRAGQMIHCGPVPPTTRKNFFRGEKLGGAGWPCTGYLQQESTFWRRSLWERAGGRLDDSLTLAGDFELWARFFQHVPLHFVGVPLGCFRVHGNQKSAQQMNRYVDEAKEAFFRHGGRVPNLWHRLLWRLLPKVPRSGKLNGLARRLGHYGPTVLYDSNEEKWRVA